MSRSRLTLSVDEDHKLFVVRYIGEIGGEDINDSMLTQLSRLDKPWEYHSIIDMRRHDATVLSSEIEDLAKRWNEMARGRDHGARIAVISEDPLVHARQNLTQAMFPGRVMGYFYTFDEGLEWIKEVASQNGKAVA
jgi:hypothetical protein